METVHVWSVRGGLLICRGKPMAYLATKKEKKKQLTFP